jgi:hypothetical protein
MTIMRWLYFCWYSIDEQAEAQQAYEKAQQICDNR